MVEKTAADEVTCDQLWSLTAGTEGLSASLKVQARIISTPLPFLLQRRWSCDQAHSLDRRTLSGLELKYQDDSDALFIPVSLSGAKTPLSLLNEMSRRMHLARCLFLDSRLGRRPAATHRSVLLHLLVVGDDLPDAVDEAALIVGDEAHEDFLLGGVEQHQHSHLARRCGVGEVHAAGL